MTSIGHQPVYELTRGDIVESLHSGSIAVVNRYGDLVAWFGDPDAVTFMRSTAKPFQAIPFIEAGGARRFNLTQKEIALVCASHCGSDEHVSVARSILSKVGVSEEKLLCGPHPITHEQTVKAMFARGEEPTAIRNNCSGKHSAMLAFARMQGWDQNHYIDPTHPVQMHILRAFAEMCEIPVEDIELGIDGCSAPNFAVPLRYAALGIARLCDPADLTETRAGACRTIVAAMQTFPEMVAGDDSFDTTLMKVMQGRLVAKGGAEGYQGIGLLPGAISPDSPSLGIALKIADGDGKGRARPPVVLEVLRQLGVIKQDELAAMSRFGPELTLQNYSHLDIGKSRPIFQLKIAQHLPLP